jgi:hypothetical protein
MILLNPRIRAAQFTRERGTDFVDDEREIALAQIPNGRTTEKSAGEISPSREPIIGGSPGVWSARRE